MLADLKKEVGRLVIHRRRAAVTGKVLTPDDLPPAGRRNHSGPGGLRTHRCHPQARAPEAETVLSICVVGDRLGRGARPSGRRSGHPVRTAAGVLGYLQGNFSGWSASIENELGPCRKRRAAAGGAAERGCGWRPRASTAPDRDVDSPENPALIGGVRLQVGSDVYDSSVRAKLDAIESGL
jgi:hypothetical protein